MTRFLAKGMFRIDRDGPVTVVFGDVVEGVIRKGMAVHIPLDGGLSVAVKIEAIEFVDRIAERISHIGLVIRNQPGMGEGLRLEKLNSGSVVLEVTESK